MMIDVQIGDIVFTNFPYSDFSELKKRPALVISKNNTRDVIVAKITSVLRNDDFCFLINPEKINFKLHKSSEIVTNCIFTIEKKLIIKKIGSINGPEMALILEKIKANFEQ